MSMFMRSVSRMPLLSTGWPKNGTIFVRLNFIKYEGRPIQYNTIQYNSRLVYAKIQDKNRPVAYYRVSKKLCGAGKRKSKK